MGIIKLLRKIFKVQNKSLLFLKVGDIVWARRYRNEKEKNKIDKGHREGPCVVIKKDSNKVYVLNCTSNPHLEVKWKLIFYPLSKLEYNLNKSTYINCVEYCELKESQFTSVLGHLNNNDLNNLNKRLYIITHSNLHSKPLIDDKYLKFKIEVGDVISYDGNKYYINKVYKKYFEVYRMRNTIKRSKSILINNTYYSFIFEKLEKIDRKSNYVLVDTFNTGEVEVINKYKDEYLMNYYNNRNKDSLVIGAIIEYKDKLFYVYEIKDDLVYTYRIFLNAELLKNTSYILVKGGEYKTFFNENVLKKELLSNNGYKIKRYASYEEIEYNKNILKLSKKEKYHQRRELSDFHLLVDKKKEFDFVPMVVLKNKNNNEYYLIIDRKDNIIELVNINNIKDSYYFELEKNNFPFEYCRIMSKEEFEKYINVINDLKEIVSMFE